MPPANALRVSATADRRNSSPQEHERKGHESAVDQEDPGRIGLGAPATRTPMPSAVT